MKLAFSAGDFIAIAFGCLGMIKWALDIFVKHEGGVDGHIDRIETSLNKLYAEFSGHKAEDRTELAWIKEALARLERKVDGLQSQMRFVASSNANRVIEMGGKE